MQTKDDKVGNQTANKEKKGKGKKESERENKKTFKSWPLRVRE